MAGRQVGRGAGAGNSATRPGLHVQPGRTAINVATREQLGSPVLCLNDFYSLDACVLYGLWLWTLATLALDFASCQPGLPAGLPG